MVFLELGAGPRQVATEQGPQEAILKELSRHEPRNQQAISMELSPPEYLILYHECGYTSRHIVGTSINDTSYREILQCPHPV